ncbi:hypothetical protein D3C84_1013900 [compost metagenome]
MDPMIGAFWPSAIVLRRINNVPFQPFLQLSAVAEDQGKPVGIMPSSRICGDANVVKRIYACPHECAVTFHEFTQRFLRTA